MYQESSFCTLNITMMKKIAYQLALIVLLNLLWLGTACERQDPEPSTSQDVSKPALWSFDDPSNPDNPYDYVGVEHNKGLEHLGNFAPQIIQLAVTNGDAAGTKQFIKDKLGEFYSSAAGGSGPPDAVFNFDEVNQPAFGDAVAGMGMSEAATSYVTNLTNNLEAMDQGQEANVRPIIEMIIQTESAIMADPSLGDHDRMMLLSGTSVMRYSAWFWIQLIYPHHYGHPWFWMLGHWGWNPYWNPYPYPYYWHKIWCIAQWDAYGAWLGYLQCGYYYPYYPYYPHYPHYYDPYCVARMSAYYSALAAMYYCWWWW
jgi:hypothetical protein